MTSPARPPGPASRTHGGVWRPLSGHVVMHSRDLDEARELVARAFHSSHTLLPTRPHGTIDARMHHAPLGRMSLNYFEYGDVQLQTTPFDGFYLVHDPLHGATPVTARNEELTETHDTGAVINSGDTLGMQFQAGARRLVARFEQTVLQEHLEGLLNEPLTDPLAFRHAMSMDSPEGAEYRRLMRYVAAEIDRGTPFLDQPLAATALEQLLMTTLLVIQPHNYSDALAQQNRPVQPYFVRRAREFIDAHAHLPLTVTDLVAATGVSGRSLFAGFRHSLRTTPMGYLRKVRLERVRAALRTSDPATTRVTDVATCWGFFHFGRFAAQYRDRFGELPSETLRRA